MYSLLLAQIGFSALTGFCLVFVLGGMYQTYRRMGLSAAAAVSKTIVMALVLLGWVLFASWLALGGYMGNFSLAPLNLVPVLLPPLVAVLFFTFYPGSQNFIRHLPAAGLLQLQAFRIPVEIFLWWLFLAQNLPQSMTFAGRNWDILAGLAGPVLAAICYGGRRYNQKLATLYNLLGLALLLNIVVTAILSLPTPFQVFFEEPDARIMATFPVMFLPTFLVPLAYSLHIFSLRKAVLESRARAAASAASAPGVA